MKKILPALLVLILLFMLSACEQDTSPTPPPSSTQLAQPTSAPTQTPTTKPIHVHTPGPWNADWENHWLACTECGEYLELSSHNANNQWDICFECDAEIKKHSQGYITVQLYDRNTKTNTTHYYDLLGNLLVTSKQIDTYNEDGYLISQAQYEDGKLIYEEHYAHRSKYDHYIISQTYYDLDDGSKLTYQFNEFGNLIRQTHYTKSGEISLDEEHEYTYSDSGVILYEHIYDSEVLVCEREYTVIGSYYARSYCSKEIILNEDGTRDVTEYTQDAKIIAEYYFDADGNLVDSSVNFDDALCSPLYGTWEGTYSVEGDTLGIPIDLRYQITVSFNDQGQMFTVFSLNREDVKVMNMELIYMSYQAYGLTRAQTDQLFETQLGMTVSEYVDYMLDLDEVQSQMRQEQQCVYYVADNFIYAGSNWTAPMDRIEFLLSGDGLVLHFYDGEDLLDTYELTRLTP